MNSLNDMQLGIDSSEVHRIRVQNFVATRTNIVNMPI